MKTLQNNFTTPEQLKRLLELGVPADSADCAYRLGTNEFIEMLLLVPKDTTYTAFADSIRVLRYRCLPCWSVGRLIDIARICLKENRFRVFTALMVWEDQVEQAIRLYTAFDKEFDFSKLEG